MAKKLKFPVARQRVKNKAIPPPNIYDLGVK